MKKTILIITLFATTLLQAQTKITILHTNDTHSCIEPEKDGNAGVLNRALLIEHIKDSVGADNTLLFDCGDFSQGSLYYNTFKGEAEIEIMNAMGYDAGAIGNHEFDFGMENLAHLAQKAKFPLLCANYDFTGTPCQEFIKPSTIIKREGIKIGIFGLSPNPEGLIAQDLYKGIKYQSPTAAAKEQVKKLRDAGCDIIICLSHLGSDMPANDCDDKRLATTTEGIDIILGGHSHTLYQEPEVQTNAAGEQVITQQLGKNGRYLGYMTVTFE